MNKIILFIFNFGLTLLVSLNLHAQNENEFGYVDKAFIKEVAKFNTRKLIIKVNPLAIISGNIPLYSSEFRLVGELVSGPKTSLILGVSYLGMGPLLRSLLDSIGAPTGQSSWDFGFNGFRIQAGFRYYLKKPRLKITDPKFKPAPRGFYIFPLISYSTAKFYLKSDKDNFDRFTHLSVTMNVGVQFLLGDKMTLDPYWGIGYKKNTITDPGGTSRLSSADLQGDFIYGTNIKLNFGLNLGVRF